MVAVILDGDVYLVRVWCTQQFAHLKADDTMRRALHCNFPRGTLDVSAQSTGPNINDEHRTLVGRFRRDCAFPPPSSSVIISNFKRNQNKNKTISPSKVDKAKPNRWPDWKENAILRCAVSRETLKSNNDPQKIEIEWNPTLLLL